MTDGLVDAMCDTGIVTPDEARSLLAAIKASGFAVQGWQDIASAPEWDDVLLCLPRYGITSFPLWEQAVGKRMDDGHWYSCGDSPQPEYRLHPPLFWMPLPSAPIAAAGDAP